MHCTGRVAKDAARYSQKLCEAIIRGAQRQLHADGYMKPGAVGLHSVEEEDTQNMPAVDSRCSGKYRDDLTGQLLRDDMVREFGTARSDSAANGGGG